MLIQGGIDPDEMDYEGSDLEKKVRNKDTLRKQWQEIIKHLCKPQIMQKPDELKCNRAMFC